MNGTRTERNRRSIRLKGFDYSTPGWYFVTICTAGSACHFGSMSKKRVVLSSIGQMVESVWLGIPMRFQDVSLDEHIMMPDHFHRIVAIGFARDEVLQEIDGSNGRVGLPDIIRWFKSYSVVLHARGVKEGKWPFLPGGMWQRNYYEHIIRNEESLNRIRNYIQENPSR